MLSALDVWLSSRADGGEGSTGDSLYKPRSDYSAITTGIGNVLDYDKRQAP
jgi:hypothetical protein